MRTSERTIAAHTPIAVTTPNCRCGMRKELTRERKPATVVNPVIDTGAVICNPVSMTAVRRSLPVLTTS